MGSVYSSELHKFVESYFNTIGAYISEKQENFFIVKFPDGLKETYTYVARVAAENKDIKLLARGSSSLNNMIKECSLKAGFSEVDAIYTEESVKSTLAHKNCCDLCPFFTICDNKDKCCDFCPYYKSCNTRLLNAEFIKLGDVKESIPLDVLCFIFLVELSNDYSLSQKVEKFVSVLIDMNTGKTIGDICFNGLAGIEMMQSSKYISISEKDYQQFMNIARQEAFEAVKNQLEVFKKEIEDTLKDKIRAIVDKYEEEYIENYTRSTLEQLEKFQDEGLKLCEREIRGYAINCDYHLKNVILLHTVKDLRNLIFKLHDNSHEVSIPTEIFLNRVDIRCAECNAEIDSGAICSNGHAACKNCIDMCIACGKPICNVCDDESYICSTCGEIVCTSCMSQCASCGAVVCPAHSYRCVTCGNTFCIDCYEICNICGSSVCANHAGTCSSCGAYVCSDHMHKCTVCNTAYCDEHIYNCFICNDKLCEEHALKSAFSGKTICTRHSGKCGKCEGVFALDELKKCALCGIGLCPEHIKICSNCEKVYCEEHINHCKSCGRDYCSCTQSVKCKLCGGTYCPDCVDSKGLCKACEGLAYVDRSDEKIQSILELVPDIAKCRKFYLGRANEINVLYAKNLISGYLAVFNNNNEILSNRKINFIEFLKTKFI
ncbi:MAG TPA: hypothetical protein PK733_14075 [Clostridiales bacterium]|nr:hypothetical protein [Clostridiales bacterium]